MVRYTNRLYIDLETRGDYSKLRDAFSIRVSNSQLFSLALTIGYYYNVKKPLIKRDSFIRYETISSDLFSVIMLLAINEYGSDNTVWIENPIELFGMAEQYANAGIEILIEKLSSDLSLDKFLTSITLELYGSVDFKSKYESLFSE